MFFKHDLKNIFLSIKKYVNYKKNQRIVNFKKPSEHIKSMNLGV